MVKKKSLKTQDNLTLMRPQESEEEEDYDVADLSAIPAPKIEFVMPNLTPMDCSEVKPTQKPKKAKTKSEAETILTSEQLNIEIVRLRPVIQKARQFLIHRLVRKMKRMELLLKKKANDTTKRKVERYEEEVHFLKRIKKDDVSKFALLNKKSLDELRITDKTNIRERCIYKLACEPSVVKNVQQYRRRYPSWETTTAFLLQRLGIQYASAEKDAHGLVPSSSGEDYSDDEDPECAQEQPIPTKIHSDPKCSKKPKTKPSAQESKCADEQSYANKSSEDINEGDSTDSGDSGDRDEAIEEESDDDLQSAENSRKLLVGPTSKKSVVGKNLVVKKKGNSQRGTPNDRKNKVTTAVVKKLKLSKMGSVELGKDPVLTPDLRQQKNTPSSSASEPISFFLPAASASTVPESKETDMAPSNTTSVKQMKLKKSENDNTNKSNRNIRVKKMKSKCEPSHPKSAKLNESSEELHPSWAARRQVKERQLCAPQSKRIVFNED